MATGSGFEQVSAQDEVMLNLLSMGFDEDLCLKSIQATGGTNIDMALNWILSQDKNDNGISPMPNPSMPSSTLDTVYDDAFSMLSASALLEYKMVLVVRKDLGMSVGKVAAQCSHAAVSLYKRLIQSNPSLLTHWESCGQKKVVTQCDSEQDMNDLEIKAVSMSVPCQTIKDAGRTEVTPGTKTVLAVLGPDHLVDQVTGKLKLLK